MEKITFSSKWHNHEFEEMIASKLRTKFPEVSFAYVQDSTGHSEEAWKSWEESVELDIRMDFGPFQKWSVYELTPFLKERRIYLDLFQPDLLEEITDEHGRIYGLPFGRGTTYTHALFYNADIFDKFGVPYPEDGMTWDEIIGLARQVTGKIDGIYYSGLDIGDYALLKITAGIYFSRSEHT
jgi:ABC-type glycerol-3-phosphate transport system substrate-binding protein